MGTVKTVLLVCRGLSEIHLLQRFQPEPDCRYIVASDDLRVYLEMEKYPWVAEVCYLEQMESFYAVASDVIRYVELINQWLESLGNDPKGIPKELLFWLRVCEGGKTTHRIQDLLLLLRSYHYLIDTYNINSIIILSHPQSQWEDEVLIKVSQAKGIRVKIIEGRRFAVVKARWRAWLKLLAREPYYVFSILQAKLWGCFRSHKPGISANEIVMQICLPDDKFVEDCVPLMKALKVRGYDPVALLWRASAAVDKIRRQGLEAAELETFVSISAIWEAPYRVWRTWRQARDRRREFVAHPGLRYRNFSLGPLLWPSVVSFFWEELAQRYRLHQAARQYFASHSPRAVRLWGGGLLAEGSICAKSLNDHQQPLTFLWIWGFFEYPYWPRQAFCDLFLASGSSQEEFYQKQGIPPQQIYQVGLSRYDHLSHFQQEYQPSQSRAFLNVPQDFQHYVLLESSHVLRGYLTIQEQSLVTGSMLNFAQEHPAVALMIKPHPAHQMDWLEALIDYFSLPNVFLLNKNMMPYHALNTADLLITKSSTMALEAMLFRKPVISVLLDGEERFRIYGEAVEKANSVEALTQILTLVVSNAAWRADWENHQLDHQARFLKEYFGDNISESAQRGAAVLDKLLSDRITD